MQLYAYKNVQMFLLLKKKKEGRGVNYLDRICILFMQ